MAPSNHYKTRLRLLIKMRERGKERVIVRDFVCFAYLKTTTIGDSVFVTTIRVFQIISAEHTIIPKFKPWSNSYQKD
jgi:hypothetical protein